MSRTKSTGRLPERIGVRWGQPATTSSGATVVLTALVEDARHPLVMSLFRLYVEQRGVRVVLLELVGRNGESLVTGAVESLESFKRLQRAGRRRVSSSEKEIGRG